MSLANIRFDLQVHKMLVDVADSLVAGGETGIFTPMHLVVFRKPLTK